MANIEIGFPKEDQPSRIKKWKVSVGTMVTAGRILLFYQDVETGKIEKKLKSTQFGKVIKLHFKENEVIHPGQPLMTIEGCKHPTVMKDLCAECGADLREEFAANPEKIVTQANIPMVHSIPELKVTAELAEKIGREDKERLLKHRQLVLLVDLDQTLVHTTNDNIPDYLEDIYKFRLYGPNFPEYRTRLRPHTRHFLSEISKLYELHICTFGARQYAHKIAEILDPDGKLFSHRILSRDECFDPQSKTANLKALFPCGVDMVCIIDDRDDVWQGCIANLVQVKPYHYFLHTGDINAPPGLGKHDDPPPKSLTEEAMKEMNLNENTENGDNKEKSNDKCQNENNIKIENIKVEDVEEEDIKVKDIKVKDIKVEDIKVEDIKVEMEEDENLEESSKINEKEKTDNNDKDDDVTSIENLDTVESNSKSDKNEGKSKRGHEKSKSRRRRDKERREKEEQEEHFKNQEMEDQDDYLLYLEDILKRIHAEFYADLESDPIRTRSLRDIIPRVRSQVLLGLHITFSGLVPNNQKLHQSRAYKVARAFGAEVSQDLRDETTHLVAIQPGTVKVREAKRKGKIKIVNPDWLWTCAERWEHVDERLYPLKEVSLHKAREFRKPPAHCSTPEIEEATPKDSFASSINPLMILTQEEIANMDKEVEEDMSDLEDFEEDLIANDDDADNLRKREHDSDSNDVYGCDYDEPLGTKRRRRDSDNDSRSSNSSDDDERIRCDDDDDDDDDPVTRFRRGEDLPDDLDLGDNSQDSVADLEAEDMEDEREWNAMGAALEREFLSE